jgi:hypothetical protein
MADELCGHFPDVVDIYKVIDEVCWHFPDSWHLKNDRWIKWTFPW